MKSEFETKFDLEQKVFIMWNNLCVESTVVRISINHEFRLNEHMLDNETTTFIDTLISGPIYLLRSNIKGEELQFYDEYKIFATKEELLASL